MIMLMLAETANDDAGGVRTASEREGESVIGPVSRDFRGLP